MGGVGRALRQCNGLRGAAERRQMEALEAAVTNLATTDEVWVRARWLARRACGKGITVPGADRGIAACAWTRGAEMEHDDAHLDALASLFG